MTLADDDTDPILTDNANGQSKAMCQCKLCNLVANFANNTNGATKLCHLVAKFESKASGAIW